MWQRLGRAQDQIERQILLRSETLRSLWLERRRNLELQEASDRMVALNRELRDRSALVLQCTRGMLALLSASAAQATVPASAVTSAPSSQSLTGCSSPNSKQVILRSASRTGTQSRRSRRGRLGAVQSPEIAENNLSRPLTAIVRDSQLLRALQAAEARLAHFEQRASSDIRLDDKETSHFTETLTILSEDEPDGSEGVLALS